MGKGCAGVHVKWRRVLLALVLMSGLWELMEVLLLLQRLQLLLLEG